MLYANLLVWTQINIIYVCFTINGINLSQITPMFAYVYHSDGGRTDPFSIGADWTKMYSNWNLSMIWLFWKRINDDPTLEKETQVKPKSKYFADSESGG